MLKKNNYIFVVDEKGFSEIRIFIDGAFGAVLYHVIYRG